MELEPTPVRLAAFHVFFAFSPSHVNCPWREMCTTFFFGGARTRNTAVLRRECMMEDMSLVAISPEPSKAYNTMTVMLGERLSIRDDVVRLSRVNCPYPLGARSRNHRRGNSKPLWFISWWNTERYNAPLPFGCSLLADHHRPFTRSQPFPMSHGVA